jgi:hypothetical protein
MNKAAVKILSVVVIAAALIAGGYFVKNSFVCFAGGGSVDYLPPTQVAYDTPIELKLTLERWAAPECLRGKTSERYSEVKCHYRLGGEAEYREIAMPLSDEPDNMRAVYKGIIPAVPRAQNQGAAIEYYFDYKINGEYRRLDEKALVLN